MVDRQRLVEALLGLVGAPQCFQGAAPIVGDDSVTGLQPGGAIQRGQGAGMIAEQREAAREIDLCGGIARQELRGTLQRLTGIGEAPEFQAGLSQQMHSLPGIGPLLRDAREQGLGRGEVALTRALDGFAGESVDLLVGEGHARPLAEAGGGAKENGQRKSRRSTGRSEERRVGKECRSRWSPYH